LKFQKDIILFIDTSIIDKIKKCVENSYPNETFGLILGPRPNQIPQEDPEAYQYHYIGEIFECVEPSEQSPVSFFMDNTEELFRILENAKNKYNRRVLSIFHSHPSGAYPSGFDRNYMKFLDNSYSKIYKNQIWTIMDASNKDLNGFIYLYDELMQISIEIRE